MKAKAAQWSLRAVLYPRDLDESLASRRVVAPARTPFLLVWPATFPRAYRRVRNKPECIRQAPGINLCYFISDAVRVKFNHSSKALAALQHHSGVPSASDPKPRSVQHIILFQMVDGFTLVISLGEIET